MINFLKNSILANNILIFTSIATILATLIGPTYIWGTIGTFLTFMPGIFIIFFSFLLTSTKFIPQRKKLIDYYSVAKGTKLIKFYKILNNNNNLKKMANTFKDYSKENKIFNLPSGGILKISAEKTEYKKDYKMQISIYSQNHEKWDIAALIHPYSNNFFPFLKYNVIPSEFHNTTQNKTLQESINVLKAIIKGHKINQKNENTKEEFKKEELNSFQEIKKACTLILNHKSLEEDNTTIHKIISNINDIETILEFKKDDPFIQTLQSEILPNLKETLNYYLSLLKLERQDLVQQEKKEIEETIKNIQELMDQYLSKTLNPGSNNITNKIKRLQEIAKITDFA